MKYISLLFLVPFLSPVSSLAQNRSILFEQGTMARALAKADSAKRLVFVDCYTSWCGPCKAMAAFVFTNDTVADFFNTHFINVQMDMEKGEGPAMVKKYSVGAFPTFLLLDAAGNIVYKFVGGMTADSFLTTIRKGIDPNNRVASMNSEYEKGNRSKAFLREYVKLKIEIKEIESGQKIADDYFNMLTPKERTQPENWYLFGENRYSLYLSDVYSRNFNYLADHWKDFAAVNGKEIVAAKLTGAYQRIAEYALRGWFFKKQPYNKAHFDRYRAQLQTMDWPDKKHFIIMMDIAQAIGERDTATVVNLLAQHIDAFSDRNKRIVLGFMPMLHSGNAYLQKYVRCREIFEKIVRTSSDKGLVNIAKTYLSYYPSPS